MKNNLTDRFIDELYELSKADFSITDIQQAKNCLLDYLGATFAGTQLIKEKGDKLLELLDGDGKYHVIGFKKKASIQTAVFINGLSSHAAELDDGVISGSVHPGSPLFSALISTGERENIFGIDFIKGILIGYEAIIRLSKVMQPSHKNKGYHATATCGAIGAAIGLAIALKMSKKQIKNALSAAVISAGGSLKAIEDNSELKPFNVANAAINALMATSMGQIGFEGPNNVLQGQRGFLSLMADEYDESQLFKNKDEALAIHEVYVKPYAACRYCHPAIDAALTIRSKEVLILDEIKSVTVKTYQLAVNNHDHKKIENVSSAKMSIPYSVAVALISGKAGIEEFTTELINNVKLNNLIRKIDILAEPEFSASFPKKSIGLVEITTWNGKKFSEKIEYPKGEPENPLNENELKEKFKILMNYAGENTDSVDRIIDIVHDLENKLEDLYLLL
jgi:2-methylcitrate dehydratase PrpD